MHTKAITSQYRRDFTAVMKCEHCGAEEINKYGYDDANYHNNVIPTMKCKSCEKSAGDEYIPQTTKYPEHLQI